MYDDPAICDLGYVSGICHYDDVQPFEEWQQTRRHIDRSLARILKLAMEGIADPIDSYTNLDY